MPIIAGIGGAAAGGGRYVNPKPTVTYNSTGKFNITNADSTADYAGQSSVTGGSLTFDPGNTAVTLSTQNTTATIRNKSIKGVTASPSTLAERKQFQYAAVYNPPPSQVGFPIFQGCPNGGTVYGGTPTQGGQCMAFFPAPYTYLVPAPGYTQAPSEWYKIT